MLGKPRILVALVGLVASQFAFAANQPESVAVGPMAFTPTLAIEESSNDNIFSQSDATGTKPSLITRVSPRLQLSAQQNANQYAITYLGDYGNYDSSPNDNYDDHTFSADALLSPTDMSTFKLSAAFAKLHDARGQGSSEGTIALSRTGPDKYDAHQVAGTLNLGIEGAPVSFEVSLKQVIVGYINNRVETQFRDRKNNDFDLRVYGNVTGKTKYFAEYGQKNIKYKHLPLYGDSLNSTEDSGYVGAEWEITGKTTGSAKIGYIKKNFDAASWTDQTIGAWQVQIVWQPLTYSTVTLTSSKQPQETNGTGSVIISTNNDVAWDHDWNDRVHSHVDAGFGRETYDNDPRTDDRSFYSMGVNYDLRRWVNLDLSYSYDSRNSNFDQFDYNRNIWAFTVSASL